MPATSEAGSTRAGAVAGAAGLALLRRRNWIQLGKFSAVGLSGYAVNLAVYSGLILTGVPYLPAAVCSFLVAVANNYTWNRLWTFRGQRGPLVLQGVRFLLVSAVALAANLAFLSVLVFLGLAKIPAQAAAIALVMPWNFAANKLWSFRRR